jgi:hypothetical protein
MQATIDAEISAIEGAQYWYLEKGSEYGALIIHSDSTSAISKAGHTCRPGTGTRYPNPTVGVTSGKQRMRRTVIIDWVKEHASVPAHKRRDELAGKAAKLVGPYTAISLAHIELSISERFWKAKDAWHDEPAHHGTEEISPPPPKTSMLDKARTSIDRVAG